MVLVAGPLVVLSQRVPRGSFSSRRLGLADGQGLGRQSRVLAYRVQLPLPEPAAVPQPSLPTVTITLLTCFYSNHWGLIHATFYS